MQALGRAGQGFLEIGTDNFRHFFVEMLHAECPINFCLQIRPAPHASVFRIDSSIQTFSLLCSIIPLYFFPLLFLKAETLFFQYLPR